MLHSVLYTRTRKIEMLKVETFSNNIGGHTYIKPRKSVAFLTPSPPIMQTTQAEYHQH